MRFNAISAIMGRRVEASRLSDRNRTGERAGDCGLALWDHGVSHACDRSRPIDLLQIERFMIFEDFFL